MRERTAKLQESISELEAFSYSISHDMRSPLRAMNAYADSIIEDFSEQLNEEALSRLQRIKRNAARLDLLIRDVLSYTRVSKENLEFKTS